MNKKRLIKRTSVLFLFGILMVPLLQAEETKDLTYVPPYEEKKAETPLNMARMLMGADIKSSRGNDLLENLLVRLENLDLQSSEESSQGEKNLSIYALIADDEAITYPILEGFTAFVVSWESIYSHNRFQFLNLEAEGEFRVYVSTQSLDFTSKKWRPVTEWVKFSGPGPVSAEFEMTEAQYVKIEFTTSKPGQIAAFGIFGDTMSAGLEEQEPDEFPETEPVEPYQIVHYNYAGIYTDTRVAYVSSYPEKEKIKEVDKMVDSDIETAYTFAEDDKSPTLIVDLGSPRTTRRVSVISESPPGEMEFYGINKLPWDEAKFESSEKKEGDSSAWNQTNEMQRLLASRYVPFWYVSQAASPLSLGGVTLPPDFFSDISPLSTAPCSPEVPNLSVNFSFSSFRYLIVRFLPKDPNKPGPVIISEINIFGNTRLKVFEPGPEEGAISDNPEANLDVPPDPPDVRVVSP